MNRLLALDRGLGRKATGPRRFVRAYDTDAPIVLRYDDFYAARRAAPGTAATALAWESIAAGADPIGPATGTELVCSDLPTAKATPQRAALGTLDSEEEAFASDVTAILAAPPVRSSGRPAVDAAVSRAAAPPQSAVPAPPAEDRHAVFDRLGYASTFDAGTIPVDWNTLDRALDAEERAAVRVQQREERERAEAQAVGVPQLDAIDLASDLATISERTPVPATEGKVDTRYEVPLVRTTGISPSVAAAAMVLAWNDGVVPNAGDIAAGLGHWEKYRDAFQSGDPLTGVGLVAEPPKRYGVADVVELLERYGPVIVGADQERVVLTGIFGDGTAKRTFVETNGSVDRRTETFEEFAAAELVVARLATPRTARKEDRDRG